MTELWLNFKDPNGVGRRVAVDNPRFTVGRHSGNDLSITDSRLSREHIVIERYGDIFVLTDVGSSNGTAISGKAVKEPVALKEGDELSLGGLEIKLEFVSDAKQEPPPLENKTEEPRPAPTPAAPESSGSMPTAVFIIAPILGLLIFSIVGLAIYFSGNRSRPNDSNDIPYSTDPDDRPSKPGRNTTSDTTPSGSNVPATPGTTNSGTDVTSNPTPSGSPSETSKTEQYAAAFLRLAAANDPKAFITGQQAQVLNPKIKSLASSSALADNINSARRNSAQIRSLAQSKNLKPQLLAAAAVAKLGTSRGDVLQTAQSMADTLDKLGVQVGNELGDDCLLMMAAYDQGAAGDFLKMRNMLQDLATKMPESSRSIRSIWYLKKNDKISDGQYELALRFLAVGTIMQNPGEFGVNAQAVNL
jgi:pSer/pThr/pTyr-binding forkhead associated (FHA) protein